MCAIVDTNVVHEVFGRQPTDAGEGFFRWLNSGKGKLVLGGKLKEELMGKKPKKGEKLKEEVNGVSEFRVWAAQNNLSGKLINADDNRVDQETEKVRSSGKLKSDDPHIIALAQVSGARLLFSNDIKLHKDFKNRNFIDEPPGKVYSTVKNKDFTESKKRLLRHCCKSHN